MKDEFRTSSIKLFVLTTFASAINYLCQILMGRVLDIQAFGAINSIFSLIIVLSVPGTTFNLLTTKGIAENTDQDERKSVIIGNLQIAILSIVTILFVGLMFNNAIREIIRIKETSLLIITIVLISIGLIYPIYTGALTGIKKFVAVGILSVIIPIFKLIGVIITAITMQSALIQEFLVLFFMFLGSVVVLYIGKILLEHNKISISPADIVKIRSKRYLLTESGMFILLINIIYAFFANADLLFVNTYFGSKEAGLYSSVMLFGRIVFYFITSLVTVMLPYVIYESKNGRNSLVILRKTLIYTFILISVSLLPLNLFPELFLKIIYGEKFILAEGYMRLASVIAILLSLLNISINYLLGINRLRFLMFSFIVGLLALTIGVIILHSSALQILIVIAVVLLVITILNLSNCFMRKG